MCNFSVQTVHCGRSMEPSVKCLAQPQLSQTNGLTLKDGMWCGLLPTLTYRYHSRWQVTRSFNAFHWYVTKNSEGITLKPKQCFILMEVKWQVPRARTSSCASKACNSISFPLRSWSLKAWSEILNAVDSHGDLNLHGRKYYKAAYGNAAREYELGRCGPG